FGRVVKYNEELAGLHSLSEHQIVIDDSTGHLRFNRISGVLNFKSCSVSDFIERDARLPCPNKPASQNNHGHNDAENGSAKVGRIEESHGTGEGDGHDVQGLPCGS